MVPCTKPLVMVSNPCGRKRYHMGGGRYF